MWAVLPAFEKSKSRDATAPNVAVIRGTGNTVMMLEAAHLQTKPRENSQTNHLKNTAEESQPLTSQNDQSDLTSIQ